MPVNFSNKFPHLQVVDINNFYRSKSSSAFIAEASEINFRSSVPIYENARDQGFILLNPETGNEVLVLLYGEEHDSNGRPSAFIYKACEGVGNLRGLDVYEFIVLNE